MSGKNESESNIVNLSAAIESAKPPVLITLDEATFEAIFPPRPNHLDANASWTYGENLSCMFETYGEEHAFVRQQDPRSIWTIWEGENDKTYLMSGSRLVNRIGYLISTNPLPEGITVQIRLSY
jgi:hypothetical protein